MLIPIKTDAPIYHWPVVTVGLIAVNTLVFVALPSSLALTLSVETWEETWILQYGNGLHPVQWVTSNFVHGGFSHLLGNMLFLWAFGIIVEGKIGWWRFLLVYFAIGTLQCASEQAITLGFAEGGSIGASAVIYGLMAMSLVWAPKNEITFVAWIFFRPFFFDVTVLNCALIAVCMQIAMAAFFDFAIGSEVLHLMGAGIGFVLGAAMLKLRLVDCENWDLFSVIAGRHEMAPEDLARLDEKSPQRKKEQTIKREEALVQIRDMIRDGQAALAYKAHGRMGRLSDEWILPEKDFLSLIVAFHKQAMWSDSIPVMVEYLRRYSTRATAVRLKLVEILVKHERRPAQALSVLAKIGDSTLSEPQHRARRQLEKTAKTLKAQGLFELEAEDW